MRQIGYVVKDIEKSMIQWVKMGVGPWFYAQEVPVDDFCYKNVPSDIQMSVALANSGFMQIELIQQRNNAPSLYRDFIQTMGEGMHHVAYWTNRFDEQRDLFLANGYSIGHSGSIGANGRLVYFLNDALPGTIIELSEMSGFKGDYFKAIDEAAMNWDGSDPIRRQNPSEVLKSYL
jgi:hypothetical protein